MFSSLAFGTCIGSAKFFSLYLNFQCFFRYYPHELQSYAETIKCTVRLSATRLSMVRLSKAEKVGPCSGTIVLPDTALWSSFGKIND
jgi:hypothetical protein